MGEVVFQDETGEEHVVPIGPEQPVISVGRSTDCTIRSNRKSVSRHHAEFRFEDGHVEIVDLDSSNGTWLMVDGERQPVGEPRKISHNDEIWCGDFILYYYEDDEGLVQESSPRVEPDFEAPQEDQDYDALQADHEALEERYQALVEELASAEEKIEETAAANRALEDDIEALSEALKEAETLEQELEASRRRVADLEEELEGAQGQPPADDAEEDDAEEALKDLLRALDRTDLTALDTIDRIRLQKVLRTVRGRDDETRHE